MAFWDKYSRTSYDTKQLCLYFVFVAIIAEIPDSYRYVVIKGDKTFTALTDSEPTVYPFEI